MNVKGILYTAAVVLAVILVDKKLGITDKVAALV